MDKKPNLRDSLIGYFSLLAKLLSFRASRFELLADNAKYLYFGLLTTWLVGVGRFWENTSAPFYLHLGVGSVIYVPILAGLLFWIVRPFKPDDWTYRRVLTFVAMTSPPGLLYAIPIQMLWGVERANLIHLEFLSIVAAWRVALLFFFLGRFAKLNWLIRSICSLLPLTAIITGLTVLNLEKVVFNFMSGIPPEARSANDASYGILFNLSLLSILLIVPLLLIYIGSIIYVNKQRRQKF